jgi:biotin synthase-related radical SAM superfamily protein
VNQLVENRTQAEADLPRRIRVSLGSAIVLGLLEGKLDAAPTTAYLMTFKPGKCAANCLFCPQARTSRSKAELLSRVSWPVFATKHVLQKIGTASASQRIRRVCIQALNYPEVFTQLTAIVKALKQHANIPVSVSCQPLNGGNMRLLAEAGADRIGIALDAATEKLFNEVKGLGETENEAVNLIQQCVNMGVSPALFAFTPIRGTALESKSQPPLAIYRRVQLARYLIINDHASYGNMRFNADGKITDFGMKKEKVMQIVETGKPFLTSGCPDCNRPFYNEKPSGPIYNYPRKICKEELSAIKRQLS